MIGNIAISLSGHDKGKAYIIIEENDRYVYLSDGRLRKTDNPKKKSKKHVNINRSFKPEGVYREVEGDNIKDHEVVQLLNIWKKSISEGNRCQKQM